MATTMTVIEGFDLRTWIRNELDRAAREGRPRPGRPLLWARLQEDKAAPPELTQHSVRLALESIQREEDPTEPTAASTDTSPAPATRRDPAAAGVASPADTDPVGQLRAEVDQARALVDLQGESALREALSPQERAEERRLAEEVRAKQREQRKRSALAQVVRENREQKVADEIAGMEQDDRLWQRRALSHRHRLLDPASRLADLYRWHAITTRGLLVLALVGIGWTAVNVQRAIVPATVPADDVVYWLGFAVEPLISAPLLVLMVLQSVAGRWGKRFGGDKAPYVYLAEALLLLLSIALNSAPLPAGHLRQRPDLRHHPGTLRAPDHDRLRDLPPADRRQLLRTPAHRGGGRHGHGHAALPQAPLSFPP